MSAETNKVISRRFFEEVWNKGSWLYSTRLSLKITSTAAQAIYPGCRLAPKAANRSSQLCKQSFS